MSANRLSVRSLLLAAALSLTACQADSDRPQAATANAEGETAATTWPKHGEQVITGNATYLEDKQLPPNSVLIVQLVDTGRIDSRPIDSRVATERDAVLANVRLVNVRGPSIPFALPYDPTEVDEQGRYGLQASLTSASGRVLFVTDTPAAVEPGDRKPIEFRMIAASDRSALHPTYWQCGPLSVNARFNQSDNTVSLAFSGRELQLPLAISGSGARYADEAGNEFWTKDDHGTLTLEGEAQPECVRTERPSPWSEAADRGVAFRAVGNEPGWWVEVDRGEAPALRAVLDYGETKLDIAHVRPAGLGFTGETGDGAEVALEIEREPCRDGMSGELFEASATLTLGDHTYSGCGAFL